MSADEDVDPVEDRPSRTSAVVRWSDTGLGDKDNLNLRKEWLETTRMSEHDSKSITRQKRTVQVSNPIFSTETLRSMSSLKPSAHMAFAITFPIHPRSKGRVTWDMLSVLLLSMDMIWLPLQAFKIPAHFVFTALPLVFWSIDIILSFCTAFYTKDGNLESNLGPIARRYLRTWFAPDVVLVGSDLLACIIEVLSDGSENVGGFARLAKMARLGRTMRCLRLLRVAKLREIMVGIFEGICTETSALVVEMLLSAITLLVINHCVACLWFFVGSAAQENTWVKKHAVEHSSPWVQYTFALHWALAQFTASMEVYPQNSNERIFTVIVIIVAMFIFSSFVSSITSGMTRLRMLKSEQAKKEYKLRSFLRENGISHDLAMRIRRHIDMTTELHRKYTPMYQVELLTHLTSTLRLDLQKQLSVPWLSIHCFFSDYLTMDSEAVSELFTVAFTHQHFAKCDVLFKYGSVASHMFFAVRGLIRYELPKTNAHQAAPSLLLHRGDWLSEAVLWLPWVHRGSAKFGMDSEVAALCARKFSQVTSKFPDAYELSKHRAHEFLASLKEGEDRKRLHDAFGLPADFVDRADTDLPASETASYRLDDFGTWEDAKFTPAEQAPSDSRVRRFSRGSAQDTAYRVVVSPILRRISGSRAEL